MLKTETIEDTIYKLSDLLDELQMVVRSTFDRSYWVIAEIVSVTEAKNGHMYLEIAEKENNLLEAKIRANLWSNAKRRILSEFEHITNQTLSKGMKVLINVTIDFHNVFGLSLNILDIDPNFSLGEIERQKQATILLLEQEGLIDFNKQHVLAPVLQSIAIISSETAAGYQDFMKQLSDNHYNYHFQTRLFQATMQGDTAADSILHALDALEKSKTNFDVVVLIRGGGSSLDLNCFDDYALASRLAQCFYPVFTGIGHERDHSIADKVAHTFLKTPTAVADHIISHNRSFEDEIEMKVDSLYQFASELINEQKQNLSHLSKSLSYNAQQKMHENERLLTHQSHAYTQAANTRLAKADFRLDKISLILKHDLKIKLQQMDRNLDQTCKYLRKEIRNLLQTHHKMIDQNATQLTHKSLNNLNTNAQNLKNLGHFIQMADPKQILKKGFSITRIDGKVLRSINDIKSNSVISTELADGTIKSKIINTPKHEQETDL